MTKKITIVLNIALVGLTISVNCKKKIANNPPTFHVEWLRELINEDDLLSEEGKSLEDIASFHYQRYVIDHIRADKTNYSESEIPNLVSFLKNPKQNLKFNKIKSNLVLVQHLGFDVSGDISTGAQLWIKTKDTWKIFDKDDNINGLSYQHVYLGNIANLQGEKLIVEGGCCDTSTIVIFDFLNDGDLKNIFSNTLYGSSYSIEKEENSYVIYEVTVEGEKSRVQL